MSIYPGLGRRVLLAGTAASGVIAGRPRASRAQTRPIRIGVLTDLSGPYSDTGGPTSVASARQAVEDFSDLDTGIRDAVKQLNTERQTPHPCDKLNKAA